MPVVGRRGGVWWFAVVVGEWFRRWADSVRRAVERAVHQIPQRGGHASHGFGAQRVVGGAVLQFPALHGPPLKVERSLPRMWGLRERERERERETS